MNLDTLTLPSRTDIFFKGKISCTNLILNYKCNTGYFDAKKERKDDIATSMNYGISSSSSWSKSICNPEMGITKIRVLP